MGGVRWIRYRNLFPPPSTRTRHGSEIKVHRIPSKYSNRAARGYRHWRRRLRLPGGVCAACPLILHSSALLGELADFWKKWKRSHHQNLLKLNGNILRGINRLMRKWLLLP